jgi:transposase, IS5 family
VPHPTTLVKLVRRAGPEGIEELNAALVDKLAKDRLLRGPPAAVDTTVVEADLDHPTDAELLEQAVRQLGGVGPAGQGAWGGQPDPVPGPWPGGRPAHAAAGPHPTPGHRGGDGRGRPADRRGRPDRAPPPGGRSRRWRAMPAGQVPAGPRMGGSGGWSMSWPRRSPTPQRLLAQTGQRLAGNRVIPDRLVSLGDPDARPIHKGKPGRPTEFGSTLLVA